MQSKHVVVFTGLAAAALALLGSAVYVSPPWIQQSAEAPAPAGDSVGATQTPSAEAPPPASKGAELQVAVKTPEPEATVPEAPPTTETLPAFDTVRVEPTGEAVIAGRAEPGAEVIAKFNGEQVGKATANADGNFAIVPDKPLQKGAGALTLQMSKNGTVTESAESVVVAVKENAPVLVAKVDPAAPTNVTQVPAAAEGPPPDTVQLNAVDYDAAGNILFSGRAKPGATVRFYVDNALAGEGLADEAGRWQFKGGEAVKPGQHVLRADQVDALGKVTSRVELPFFRETEEVVASAQPVVPQAEQPADPQLAKPGTKMASEEVIVPQRLVIQPGHSLWKLSRQIYGRGKYFTVIYEANRDQLRNPNRIYPGQILSAPRYKSN